MNELFRVFEDMKRGKSKAIDVPKQSTFSDFKCDCSRVQSPSSINTYFDCPRKYFFRYIKELPSKPSIHLIRGKLIHSVLEDFFKLDPHKLTPSSFDFELKVVLVEDFNKKWQAEKDSILKLGLGKEERLAYFSDSKKMIGNFVDHFAGKIKPLLEKMPLHHAFTFLTPESEIYLESKLHKVRGYIDALYRHDKVSIIDYKTSSTDTFRDEYRRQLAIYSLMYFEKFGKLPDEVGIHFLLYGLKTLPVTMGLVEEAKNACCFVHGKTSSPNQTDYPKGQQPLCKWSTGSCDFFETCGGK